MTVKCTGTEFIAFMTDDKVWQNNAYFDDASATIDGKDSDLDFDFDNEPSAIAPEAEVRLESGVFYHGDSVGAENEPMETVLKRWLKARTVTTMVIDLPKDQKAAFQAALKAQFPDAKVR